MAYSRDYPGIYPQSLEKTTAVSGQDSKWEYSEYEYRTFSYDNGREQKMNV
jgi:hypothetical protein